MRSSLKIKLIELDSMVNTANEEPKNVMLINLIKSISKPEEQSLS